MQKKTDSQQCTLLSQCLFPYQQRMIKVINTGNTRNLAYQKQQNSMQKEGRRSTCCTVADHTLDMVLVSP